MFSRFPRKLKERKKFRTVQQGIVIARKVVVRRENSLWIYLERLSKLSVVLDGDLTGISQLHK